MLRVKTFTKLFTEYIILFSSRQQARTAPGEKKWSGAATKNINYFENSNEVAVTIGDNAEQDAAKKAAIKERPVWMTDSTIGDVTIEPAEEVCFHSTGGPYLAIVITWLIIMLNMIYYCKYKIQPRFNIVNVINVLLCSNHSKP